MITETFLLIFCLLLFLELSYRKRPKHYPPGPRPLPVIGNMLNLAPNPLKSLPQLHQKYGNILALDFGYYRTVIINDVNLLRELYATEASNGAPPLLGMELDHSSAGKPLGILTLNGEQHTQVLKLLRKSAKELTESIPVIDHLLLESADFIIDAFDAASKANELISSKHCFYYTTLNTVWRWITGEPAHPLDPTIAKILNLVLEFFESLGSGIMSFFFPWICKLAPGPSGWNKVQHINRKILTCIQENIDNHKRSMCSNDRLTNLIDAFQETIHNNADPTSALYKDLGYLNARATYLAFLYGGIETTAATLIWATLYMLKTPGVQESLHREIDEIIGNHRRPSVSDRYRMPYTMSFLNETFRIAPVGPLGVPRRLIADLSFHGYSLPKDTVILPNIHALHHDKSVWGADAHQFQPERFLNDNSTKPMTTNLFNFGSGKRSCPGEPLARQQIFIIFVSLLQVFQFHADSPESIGIEGDVTRQALKPLPFSFKVKRRLNPL